MFKVVCVCGWVADCFWLVVLVAGLMLGWISINSVVYVIF